MSFKFPRFASVLLIAALAAIPGTSSAEVAPKKVIVSQAFQSLLYLPFYVAMDKGFFKKEGLDVEKQTAGSPSTALAAVISGSAEFSIHGPEWTAIAIFKRCIVANRF